MAGLSAEPLGHPVWSAAGGRDAARAAGAAAPAAMLDINGQNLPLIGKTRPKWGRKHWRTKRACEDFLIVAERMGWHAFFLTLTSSRSSDGGRLREDWQALRKRLTRKMGLSGESVVYTGVDTWEGNGVLHLLVAVPPGRGRSGRFLVGVEWLRSAWDELHLARQLRIVPVRRGGSSARKLSRYLVAQYVGGQDALIRCSRSRLPFGGTRLREAWRRVCFSGWSVARLYATAHRADDALAAVAALRSYLWHCYRVGWEGLLRGGQAALWDRSYIVGVFGELEEL